MAIRKRSVLVVSDQVLFRQSLAAVLRDQDMQVVDQASTSPLRSKRPDTAVVDLAHVSIDTTTLVQNLHDQLSGTHVVLVGSATRLAAAHDGEPDAELELPRADLSALRGAVLGRRPTVSSELSRLHRLWAQVTTRQRDVLRYLAGGLDNPAIAAKLRVGTRAIKAHISALLALFGLDSRTQLALIAHEGGLKPR